MNTVDPGYSFMETLIALAISLILSASIGIPAIKYIEKAKYTSALIQIESFRLALDSYYFDCGNYPETEQGLEALIKKPTLHPVSENWNGPYISKKVGLDPWGSPWIYTKPGKDGFAFEIMSYGKDKQEGGTHENKDISSNQ